MYAHGFLCDTRQVSSTEHTVGMCHDAFSAHRDAGAPPLETETRWMYVVFKCPFTCIAHVFLASSKQTRN